MVKIDNLFNNQNILEIESRGAIRVLEHQRDLSLTKEQAMHEYYAGIAGIRRRQAVIQLDGTNPYTISAGAMQWTSGNVNMVSNVKGIGDFLGKFVTSRVTGEAAIKPKYNGEGLLVLEPTYKYLLIEDVAEWGSLVLEDGLFLACESRLQQKVIARSNLSSAAFGGEGLFNLMLSGNGLAILESPCPRTELVTVNLTQDEIRIDGSYAIAWSGSLEFRTETSSKSLIGSAVSGEGLVNVYRGTGRILMAPIS